MNSKLEAEVEAILNKLDGNEAEKVRSYIDGLRREIEKLQNNITMLAQIINKCLVHLNALAGNLNSAGLHLQETINSLLPILKPKEG